MPLITNKISLSDERAAKFGIADKPMDQKERLYIFTEVRNIQENGNQVTVTAIVNDQEKILTYDKSTASNDELTFIGWAYLLLSGDYQAEKTYQSKAGEYLYLVIKDEIGFDAKREKQDPLPYYLIAKYRLKIEKVGSIRGLLYHFLKHPENLFEDFFNELINLERNPLRKVRIAKLGEKLYPESSSFTRIIADNLYKHGKISNCISYLSERKKVIPSDDWQEQFDVRMTLIDCHIQKRKYTSALTELEKPLIGYISEYTSLMKGIICFQQHKIGQAREYFEDAIQSDYADTEVSTYASFFLISCYTQKNNSAGLEDIISSLLFDEYDLQPIELPKHYEADVKRILLATLKKNSLEETLKGKVKGIIAFFLFSTLPGLDMADYPRKLTNAERQNLNKALTFVKDAVDFFPIDVFFNALYSNLLYIAQRFDEAMDYKLRSIARSEEDYIPLYSYTDLESCSDEYISNYPQNLSKAFDRVSVSLDKYVERSEFERDISSLWKKKRYKEIADLYKLVKHHIVDATKIGGIYPYGDLFQVAYSLAEVDEKEDAKAVYETCLVSDPDSSAVLNNLAIIYEKEGNTKQAQDAITKAQQASPDDELINRNFKRITEQLKNDTPDKPTSSKSEKPEEKIPKFNIETGEITLGEKSCEIPLSSNQFQLCKALFAIPISNWLKENDVIDNFFRGKGKQRSFYDAVRLINQKVHQELNIRNLLEYNASRVRIRKEVLGKT